MLEAAWNDLITDGESMETHHVTLYNSTQCYGGPEEGGWYYDAVYAVETKRCDSKSEAKQLADRVEARADEMTAESKRQHDETCRRQCEQIEANDPMADIVDYGGPYADTPGIESFFIEIETTAGSRTTHERPHYE